MWFGSDDRDYDRRSGWRYDRYDRDGDRHDPDEYWYATKQPLAIFLFVLPMIAAYELGAYFIKTGNAEPVRNGADYWLRSGLARFGFEQPWLLPAAFLGALVAWQVLGGYRWRVSGYTLLGMLLESAIFGLCLVLIGEAQEMLFRELQPAPPDAPQAAMSIPNGSEMTRAVSYLGAGIYEEVLFRAAILPVLFVMLRPVASRNVAIFLAVVGSSVLFSAAHYIGPAGDPFNIFGFLFRAIAGGFFAVVMVLRGFGVTVGTHAAYDILVGILLPANLLETWMSGN